jgi:hypothetical protein
MVPSPEAYLHIKDRFAAQMLDWGIPWRLPCSDIDEESRPDLLWEEQCFRFGKPQRMQGLWRNDFEGSEICPLSAGQCPTAADKAAERFTWLQTKFHLAGAEDTPPGGLYAIDFIGRRSEHLGLYGHMGMSEGEVIVDRLLSIKLVEPPPPGQMTPEHVKAYLKECEGARICMPNSEVAKSTK